MPHNKSKQSKYYLDQGESSKNIVDKDEDVQEIQTVKTEVNTSDQLAVYGDQGYQGYSESVQDDYSADCSDLFPQGQCSYMWSKVFYTQ